MPSPKSPLFPCPSPIAARRYFYLVCPYCLYSMRGGEGGHDCVLSDACAAQRHCCAAAWANHKASRLEGGITQWVPSQSFSGGTKPIGTEAWVHSPACDQHHPWPILSLFLPNLGQFCLVSCVCGKMHTMPFLEIRVYNTTGQYEGNGRNTKTPQSLTLSFCSDAPGLSAHWLARIN
jgi:hypothetical protein